MSTQHAPPPLSVADLATRWQLSEKEVHRRLKQIHLPSINVGTAKDPKLRFRLATVEAWEAANEVDRSQAVETPAHEVRVPAGMPPGWEGDDVWGDMATKAKGRKGRGAR